jgi:2,3-bisphosphoglycerate-independent phosphoglycerate mutase
MKKIVILADGSADEPIEMLGGKTPLMAAHTPNIDTLCKMGTTGLLKSVPDSLPPGSEVANMMIMGYDAETYYQGRGVLEAAALGIDIEESDLVMRCNLITTEADTLVNHSAGHISTEEADMLIQALNENIGNDDIRFYTGVSYRHVLVIKNAGKELPECTPPHDVPGKKFSKYLPSGKGEIVEKLNSLILRSKDILNDHPVNKAREEAGKPAANMAWPWSPGHKPAMPSLKELYGIESGAVISAVDLIHGLARFAGMDSIHVDGATGLYDTNYKGKAEAAIKALQKYEYVYLHIEAPDEAGHEGDVDLKIRTIEDIDRYVAGPVLEYALKSSEPVAVALLPDHPTPCKIRTHTRTPVPFIIYKPGTVPDEVTEFNEETVKQGHGGTIYGTEFMKLLNSSGQ